jgi:hypothetical protein
VDGGTFALSIVGPSTMYVEPFGPFFTKTTEVELNMVILQDIFSEFDAEVRFVVAFARKRFWPSH